MFTVEQRDALRGRVLVLAEQDERVVAGAAVGSLAVDAADRFSDVDLTFGITHHVPVAEVLDDWTGTLIDELDAVRLADLERGPTTYRVFLLPGALQLDLSMTPPLGSVPPGHDSGCCSARRLRASQRPPRLPSKGTSSSPHYRSLERSSDGA